MRASLALFVYVTEPALSMSVQGSQATPKRPALLVGLVDATV